MGEKINMENLPHLGTKEYFRLEVAKLHKKYETKEFWEDLEQALTALGELNIIWAKTQDAEHRDGILMKETQTEFETRYRQIVTYVMESTKLH
jgi:hypothetical protein